MKRRTVNCESLASDLAKLSCLDRSELMDLWQRHYKMEPPSRISSGLLTYAIAYQLQELASGGLKPSTARFLERIVDDAFWGKQTAPLPQVIKPGTRLLREWHGVTHEVIIQSKGVSWNGKQCRSLSEVARHITGAHWSGPLFFGLKSGEAS